MSRVALVASLAVALALPAPAALGAEPHAAPETTRPQRQPGDRMVQAGVGVTVVGLLGYGLMAAGLGIGNQAEDDLLYLAERDDIERRREVIARGRLGNRLAIGGAVTATVAIATGLTLIVVGRRRHQASMRRASVMVGGVAGGIGVGLRGRF